IWWSLLLPILIRTKRPIVIAILLAVFAGFLPWGYPLSIGRTLVFLPFFVVGHIYGRQMLTLLSDLGRGRFVAILWFPIAASIVYGIDFRWFYGTVNFRDLGIGADGKLIRSGLMMLGGFSILALMCCVSRDKGWLSQIGRSSLAIF